MQETPGPVLQGGGQQGHALVEAQQPHELEGGEEDGPAHHVGEELVPVAHVLELDVIQPFGLLEALRQLVGLEQAVEVDDDGTHGHGDDPNLHQVPEPLHVTDCSNHEVIQGTGDEQLRHRQQYVSSQ